MKKVIFILLGLFLGGQVVLAQQFSLGLSYQWLHASQWNKAVETYNFSRPFLTEKQPLLRSGVRLDAAWILRENGKFSWGPALAASFHHSAADNPNYDIAIHAFLLDLGVRLQYLVPIGQNSSLNLSFTPAVTGAMLTRSLNGEIVIVGPGEEDQPLRKAGVGLGLNFQLAFDLPMGQNWKISPLLGVNYDPMVWVSRSEVVFNEATVGELRSVTSLIRFQGGFAIRK
ncbi:MAG: hypothetical protein H6581_28230 [Bacteroidia bacterium]|nr:hypothetical protein [Bacteroidia bacterium]